MPSDRSQQLHSPRLPLFSAGLWTALLLCVLPLMTIPSHAVPGSAPALADGFPAYHVRILRARFDNGFPGSALFRPEEILIPASDRGLWGHPDQLEALRRSLGASALETVPGLVVRTGPASDGGPYRFRTTLGTEVVDLSFLGEPLGDAWHRIHLAGSSLTGEDLLDAVFRIQGPGTFALVAPLPDGSSGLILAVTPLTGYEAASSPAAAGAQPEAGTETLTPILVMGDVVPPQLLLREQPIYPENAREEGLQGKIYLQATIDLHGVPGQILVLSMFPGGERLAGAAVEAVRQWRYAPATLHGRPVPTYFNIVLDFTLLSDEEQPGESTDGS